MQEIDQFEKVQKKDKIKCSSTTFSSRSVNWDTFQNPNFQNG